MTYRSTLPNFESALPRVSDFQRRMRALGHNGDSLAGISKLSSLDASLLQDLRRFEAEARAGGGLEVLQVVAAAVRHGRPLKLTLQHEEHLLQLIIMPKERLAYMPVAREHWTSVRWYALMVLQVEPAVSAELLTHQQDERTAPLALVLWWLAMHGSRSELLPEIAGQAAYRIAPSTDLSGMELPGALAATVQRLRRHTSPLRDIESWPGMGRERAMRLLNALYLQAGLMVSRAHPAATGPH
jgi:hypothetical protein